MTASLSSCGLFFRRFFTPSGGLTFRFVARLTCLLIAIPATQAQQPDAAPVNPDATPEARALLRQIDGVSGKGILSGAHNYPNTVSRYSDRVYELTGKYPAIFGQDFGFSGGEDKDSTLSRSAMIREVIRQYRAGSVPALCWHAVRPAEDEPVTFRGSILGKLTDWEFHQLLTPGTELHARWERQVDRIAGYLRQLEDAGVPVLFRPYHEMNGDWFWWGGRPGAEGTAALYRMLFDRYVHVHHLNNLLWVWNVAAASSKSGLPAQYWPGPGYADIVSMDIYRPYTQSDYESMLALAGARKPIALAEVGTMPTREVLASQPRWTYMMVWSEFAEDHNTPSQLRSIFNAPEVIDRGDPRLFPPLPPPPAAPIPRDLLASPAARALLAALSTGSPQVTELNLGGTSPQVLAAELGRLARAGHVPLLRWSPSSPTGESGKPLDDFEWSELRRPGSRLHAAWLTQIDSIGVLLQQTQHTAVLFSPLPRANGNAWWSRPGPEGSQALLREVQQRLAPQKLNDILWAWEPSAEVHGDTLPAATLEAFFPGPLMTDVFLLDTAEDPGTRDGMLQSLREIAAGRPVGLRAAKNSPNGGVPYDFLVVPTQLSPPATAGGISTEGHAATGAALSRLHVE